MGTTSKALSLLAVFSRNRPAIGLSDMARLSGLNKATVHRLLTELAAQGFVEQAGAGREYRLGPAFLRLAALRERAVPMRETATTVLNDLAAATGETAHMSLLQGEVLSAFAHAYSTAHGTSVMMDDVHVLPLHATSSGLAVLAHAPPALADAALSRPLPARTPQTLTDPATIRGLFAAIRSHGVAVSAGGFEADVHSHAAPVFDADAACIGAVAVAAPVARMNDELGGLIRAELLTRARRLTRLLGGFAPGSFPSGART